MTTGGRARVGDCTHLCCSPSASVSRGPRREHRTARRGPGAVAL